jgi:hypothetical protein
LLQVLLAERFLPHAVAAEHSLLSVQVSLSVPLPVSVKPLAHVQLKPPVEFVQVLLAERSFPHAVDAPHSSRSPHDADKPLPVAPKPAPHVHE